MCLRKKLHQPLSNFLFHIKYGGGNNKTELIEKFHKCPKANAIIKNTQIKFQSRPCELPVKQEAGPIPYHLQEYIKKKSKN